MDGATGGQDALSHANGDALTGEKTRYLKSRRAEEKLFFWLLLISRSSAIRTIPACLAGQRSPNPNENSIIPNMSSG